jgi:hypothetical protein
MIIKDQVEDDIQNWIINYIEVNHKFYNYKFPPCPYARSARLKGQLDISVYESGNVLKFIKNQIDQLITLPDLKTRVIVFPPKIKYYFWLPMMIRQMNKRIIELDYYAQYGTAIHTQSAYNGILKNKPYRIVIVNKLSDVLDGHKALLNTDYYTPWADHHYNAVVTIREKLYEKHKRKD